MADLESEIEENAQGLKRASGDSGSAEQHPLPDQIEADKYLSNKTATATKRLGLRFVKIIPPGAV